MKDINELLKLLRYQVDERLDTGMCKCVDRLFSFCKISNNEALLLDSYIYFNEPMHVHGGYWFPPGYKQPRIKWLDEQIELTNK